MKRWLLSLLSLATVAMLALPAGAQIVGATNPGGAYFRLFGGATFPTGDFGDAFDTGWRGGGTIGWQLAGIPIGFDLDVAYDRLGGGEFEGVDLGDAAITSGTANIRWDYQGEGSVGFFLAGGGGIYHFSEYDVESNGILTDRRIRGGVVYGGDTSDSQNEFGLNAGGGLIFGRGNTRFFVEARYHSVFTEGKNTNFIPIAVGVQFGPPRM